jgi:hypothetical protein
MAMLDASSALNPQLRQLRKRFPVMGSANAPASPAFSRRAAVPVELEPPPPLDTQKGIALAVAAVGRAVPSGEITPAEAVELGHMFETAMRAIERRESEFATDHFWGRKRPPAAPPLARSKRMRSPIDRPAVGIALH